MLIKLDVDWIPRTPGHALYIRPTMIGTGTAIGLHQPTDGMLYVICSPCQPYYDKELGLLATEEYSRSFPRGTSEFKIGANYSPCLFYLREAKDQGLDQNLWLYDGKITEAGTMNIFCHWIDSMGIEKISTPPDNGLILPGIIRDSIIQIMRNFYEIPIIEEMLEIKDIISSIKQKRIKSIFGTGTAATIVPINRIEYQNETFFIKNSDYSLMKSIHSKLQSIQLGKIEFHNWAYSIKD